MFDLYRQSEVQPLTILSYASAWSNGVALARDEEADRFAVRRGDCPSLQARRAPGKSGTSPTSRRSGSRSQTRVTTPGAEKDTPHWRGRTPGRRSSAARPACWTCRSSAPSPEREVGTAWMSSPSTPTPWPASGPQRLERQLRQLHRMAFIGRPGRSGSPRWAGRHRRPVVRIRRIRPTRCCRPMPSPWRTAGGLFWFNLVDWGGEMGSGWTGPSSEAGAAGHRVVSSQLDGAQFKGRIPLLDAWVYVFERDRMPVATGLAPGRGRLAENADDAAGGSSDRSGREATTAKRWISRLHRS